MEKEMKLKQFIGIFPNAISDKVCSEFVKCFNEISEQGLTMSSMKDGEKMPPTLRNDEVINIPKATLPNRVFPDGLSHTLWGNIEECLNFYKNDNNLIDPLTAYDYKIHRVRPTGGYHLWHHEHGFNSPYRVLVWMLIIEAPVSGGETEFLHQSMRVSPKVGQLVIWPAGFTHKHRGNPPLEGQKTYITGWFDATSWPEK
jgi:hypothetical protein